MSRSPTAAGVLPYAMVPQENGSFRVLLLLGGEARGGRAVVYSDFGGGVDSDDVDSLHTAEGAPASTSDASGGSTHQFAGAAATAAREFAEETGGAVAQLPMSKSQRSRHDRRRAHRRRLSESAEGTAEDDGGAAPATDVFVEATRTWMLRKLSTTGHSTDLATIPILLPRVRKPYCMFLTAIPYIDPLVFMSAVRVATDARHREKKAFLWVDLEDLLSATEPDSETGESYSGLVTVFNQTTCVPLYLPMVRLLASPMGRAALHRLRAQAHMYSAPRTTAVSATSSSRRKSPGTATKSTHHDTSDADDDMSLQLVVPGLWISGVDAANNRALLISRGITHVVCAINRREPHHRDALHTLLLPVEDRPAQPMRPYLSACMAFIDRGRATGGVLVHCQAGRSRSATIVLAYLMRTFPSLRSFPTALSFLRSRRSIVCPNTGFTALLGTLSSASTAHRHRITTQSVSLPPSTTHYATAVRPPSNEPEDDAQAPPHNRLTDSQVHCLACDTTLTTTGTLFDDHSHCATDYLLNEEGSTSDVPQWYTAQALACAAPSGDLLCPQCESVVGRFHWSGILCRCAMRVVPGFLLYDTACMLQGATVGRVTTNTE